MPKKYSNIQHKSTNVRYNYRRHIVRLTILFLHNLFPISVENFIKKQFFSPNHYPVTDQEIDLLNESTSFEFQLHQKTIKCWRWGDGPYILLAHGWNGHGSQFIYIIRRLISAGYSVIIFDGPAHGQSEGTSSSYFQMTDAVRRLISFVKPENILGLIGHSFGASAIINTISKENIFKKIILLAPALNIQKILEDTFLSYGISINVLYKLIYEYEQTFDYNLKNDNPVNLVKSIEQELLIIHDKDDTVTPHIDSKKISNTYKNIRIKTTTGLGHKRILIDPQVAKWIIKYLKK
jgi:pimeloyl-ACP methyl ester carboxylesterase